MGYAPGCVLNFFALANVVDANKSLPKPGDIYLNTTKSRVAMISSSAAAPPRLPLLLPCSPLSGMKASLTPQLYFPIYSSYLKQWG